MEYASKMEVRLKAVVDKGINALANAIPEWRGYVIAKEQLDSIKTNMCSEEKLATLSSAYVATSAIQADVKDVCERLKLNIAVTHKASMRFVLHREWVMLVLVALTVLTVVHCC